MCQKNRKMFHSLGGGVEQEWIFADCFHNSNDIVYCK